MGENKEELMYESIYGIKYILDTKCVEINRKAAKGFSVYICEFKNGEREYVIFNSEGDPIFTNEKVESVDIQMELLRGERGG